MNIHEYQAKEIFKEYGLPVAPFFVSRQPVLVRLPMN